jgi:sugar phosphate isomerase/epimerase
MRILVFTKPFGAIGIPELAAGLATLRKLGALGVDLVVRDGQAVTPSSVERLGPLRNTLARNDITLDVATTDLLAADAEADRVLGACAAEGIGLVRAGFYRYDPTLGYRRCLAEARPRLAGLAELAAGHGVRLAVQLHHGTIHPSAAHVSPLVDGLDVAVYADPGNQVKEGGEDWRLCLDLLGDRLSCVGVKNAAWHGSTVGWTPLADGVVDWSARLAELRARSYDGPLSLHVHYPTNDVVGTLRSELTYLLKTLSRTMVSTV